MTKIHATITIDEDLKRTAKEFGLNLSELCNEALAIRIGQNTDNPSKISLEIEQKRVKKAQKELLKWQNELKNSQKNIEIYQKMMENKEMEHLETQKREAEIIIKCKNCGIIRKSEQLFDFKIGKICKGCYLAASGEDVKRWNNG